MSQDLAATVAGLEALREREYSKMGMRAEWDIQANKHIATLTAAIALLREQEETSAKLAAAEKDARLLVGEFGQRDRADIGDQNLANFKWALKARIAERDAAVDVLKWLQAKGGLGLDVHAKIETALAIQARGDGGLGINAALASERKA